jgi:hypothetical protein
MICCYGFLQGFEPGSTVVPPALRLPFGQALVGISSSPGHPTGRKSDDFLFSGQYRVRQGRRGPFNVQTREPLQPGRWRSSVLDLTFKLDREVNIWWPGRVFATMLTSSACVRRRGKHPHTWCGAAQRSRTAYAGQRLRQNKMRRAAFRIQRRAGAPMGLEKDRGLKTRPV